MNFNEYVTDDTLNEAVSKRWKQILANPKDVHDAGYTNSAGRLDLSWYSCKGCINFGMNKRGTLYKLKNEDWMFLTYFNTNKSLSVIYYDANGDLMDQELIGLTPLTKMMVKSGAWKGRPVHINKVATSKYVTFQSDPKYKSVYNFVFSDAMEISVNVYKSDELAVQKGNIESKIKEIESWGYKIAKKVKPDLERLFPELYGEVGFELSNKIWLLATKLSTKAEFQQFINNIDNDSRTGSGIKFSKNGFRVHGMIGNMSSGYESQEFIYKKVPTTLAAFKKFLTTSGALKYIIGLQLRMSGESKRYTDYMANGGAMD